MEVNWNLDVGAWNLRLRPLVRLRTRKGWLGPKTRIFAPLLPVLAGFPSKNVCFRVKRGKWPLALRLLKIANATFMLFLGQFHPLLVHLPIGGLVLLAVLELVAHFTRFKDAAQNNIWIVSFVCTTAAVSALCGWLLATGGGYDAELLKWHRVLGVALAVGCLLSLLLLQRDWLRAYRASLAAALALLAITGYLGGALTHGGGFLSRNAPAGLQPLAGYAMSRDGEAATASLSRQAPVFAGIVQPILQERCVSCHNPEKHKADLRLDNFAVLLQGGQNGPVIKPGRARESSLIQRMLLASDADLHMPPEGQSQPTAEEIAVLDWWVNAGAPTDQKLADLKPSSEILRLVKLVRGQLGQAKVGSGLGAN